MAGDRNAHFLFSENSKNSPNQKLHETKQQPENTVNYDAIVMFDQFHVFCLCWLCLVSRALFWFNAVCVFMVCLFFLVSRTLFVLNSDVFYVFVFIVPCFGSVSYLLYLFGFSFGLGK